MDLYKSTYYGEYKKGIFEKIKLLLHIYSGHIEGVGIIEEYSKYSEHSFNVEMQYIEDIREIDINGNSCLEIRYLSKSLFANRMIEGEKVTVLFFNMNKLQEAISVIKDFKAKDDKLQQCKQEEINREQERKERLENEKKQHAEECLQYFQKCMDFHMMKDNNPYYELQNDYLQFIGIYVDKQKNLNFVSIDGIRQQESNACIAYDKIHYYEKAGSIHYTTEIRGHYDSFGGSFSGGKISKKATMISGLLFGPMGMAAGAVLTHKPAIAEMPSTSFDIESDIQRIDERSVILNYYSDSKKQFMDIELPADIYNFLQTHLPEKKYGIVLEVEKEKALKEQSENVKPIEQKVVAAISINDDMVEFENKIKKLVIMHDNGLLSDEEFENEKKRILSSL